jgi:opine dehydrogenase
MKIHKSIVTIVGGGNSSYTLTSLLSNAGHTINLLTRRPEQWSNEIRMELTFPDGTLNDVLSGRINKVSDNPKDVIPEADIIILSLPVSKYRTLLHFIAPFLNRKKRTIIGTVYGQGGFNWMVNEIISKFQLETVVYFASGLIPWITRTREYGKTGINYGPKSVNIAAVFPPKEFSNLNELLFDDLCYTYFGVGKYVMADNFLSLTLSVDNQIIHLSRLFGLNEKFGGYWQTIEKVPYFYRDFDDLSAKLLEKLDADYSKIRKEIRIRYPQKSFKYMLDYINLERLSYNSSNSNIRDSFINSKTLNQIPTPVIKNEFGLWTFDKNHRFFMDDLYYGLAIAKWIGQKLNLDTPVIDRIINWAQDIVNDVILDNCGLIERSGSIDLEFKTGIPSTYGFSSIDQIID